MRTIKTYYFRRMLAMILSIALIAGSMSINVMADNTITVPDSDDGNVIIGTFYFLGNPKTEYLMEAAKTLSSGVANNAYYKAKYRGGSGASAWDVVWYNTVSDPNASNLIEDDSALIQGLRAKITNVNTGDAPASQPTGGTQISAVATEGTDWDKEKSTWTIPATFNAAATLQLQDGWTVDFLVGSSLTDLSGEGTDSISVEVNAAPFNAAAKLIKSDGSVAYIGIEKPEPSSSTGVESIFDVTNIEWIGEGTQANPKVAAESIEVTAKAEIKIADVVVSTGAIVAFFENDNYTLPGSSSMELDADDDSIVYFTVTAEDESATTYYKVTIKNNAVAKTPDEQDVEAAIELIKANDFIAQISLSGGISAGEASKKAKIEAAINELTDMGGLGVIIAVTATADDYVWTVTVSKNNAAPVQTVINIGEFKDTDLPVVSTPQTVFSYIPAAFTDASTYSITYYSDGTTVSKESNVPIAKVVAPGSTASISTLATHAWSTKTETYPRVVFAGATDGDGDIANRLVTATANPRVIKLTPLIEGVTLKAVAAGANNTTQSNLYFGKTGTVTTTGAVDNASTTTATEVTINTELEFSNNVGTEYQLYVSTSQASTNITGRFYGFAFEISDSNADPAAGAKIERDKYSVPTNLALANGVNDVDALIAAIRATNADKDANYEVVITVTLNGEATEGTDKLTAATYRATITVTDKVDGNNYASTILNLPVKTPTGANAGAQTQLDKFSVPADLALADGANTVFNLILAIGATAPGFDSENYEVEYSVALASAPTAELQLTDTLAAAAYKVTLTVYENTNSTVNKAVTTLDMTLTAPVLAPTASFLGGVTITDKADKTGASDNGKGVIGGTLPALSLNDELVYKLVPTANMGSFEILKGATLSDGDWTAFGLGDLQFGADAEEGNAMTLVVAARVTATKKVTEYGTKAVTGLTDYQAPIIPSAEGLTVSTAAKVPPVANTVTLLIKEAAEADHTLYYRTAAQLPTAPKVGDVITIIGSGNGEWALATSGSAIVVDNGSYVEVAEADDTDKKVTRWGFTGSTGDGVAAYNAAIKEITATSGAITVEFDSTGGYAVTPYQYDDANSDTGKASGIYYAASKLISGTHFKLTVPDGWAVAPKAEGDAEIGSSQVGEGTLTYNITPRTAYSTTDALILTHAVTGVTYELHILKVADINITINDPSEEKPVTLVQRAKGTTEDGADRGQNNPKNADIVRYSDSDKMRYSYDVNDYLVIKTDGTVKLLKNGEDTEIIADVTETTASDTFYVVKVDSSVYNLEVIFTVTVEDVTSAFDELFDSTDAPTTLVGLTDTTYEEIDRIAAMIAALADAGEDVTEMQELLEAAQDLWDEYVVEEVDSLFKTAGQDGPPEPTEAEPNTFGEGEGDGDDYTDLELEDGIDRDAVKRAEALADRIYDTKDTNLKADYLALVAIAYNLLDVAEALATIEADYLVIDEIEVSGGAIAAPELQAAAIQAYLEGINAFKGVGIAVTAGTASDWIVTVTAGKAKAAKAIEVTKFTDSPAARAVALIEAAYDGTIAIVDVDGGNGAENSVKAAAIEVLLNAVSGIDELGVVIEVTGGEGNDFTVNVSKGETDVKTTDIKVGKFVEYLLHATFGAGTKIGALGNNAEGTGLTDEVVTLPKTDPNRTGGNITVTGKGKYVTDAAKLAADYNSYFDVTTDGVIQGNGTASFVATLPQVTGPFKVTAYFSAPGSGSGNAGRWLHIAQDGTSKVDKEGTINVDVSAIMQELTYVYSGDGMPKITLYGRNTANSADAGLRIYDIYIEAMDDDVFAESVSDMIDRLDSSDETYISDVAAARTAYNALTDTQRALITNEEDLKDAEAAVAVIILINAIDLEEATETYRDDVDEAREAYEELSSGQQALVDAANYSDLTDAEGVLETVQDVIDLIDAIAEIDKNTNEGEYAAAVNAAADAFDELDDENLQALVTNHDDLIAAQASLATQDDKDAAGLVQTAIGELDIDTPTGYIQAVKDARVEYDKLTAVQKALITEEELTKLVTEEAHVTAAETVINLITALNDTDFDYADTVEAARTAYDALTEARQGIVSNIDDLVAAEDALDVANAVALIKAEYLGDIIAEVLISKGGDAEKEDKITAIEDLLEAIDGMEALITGGLTITVTTSDNGSTWDAEIEKVDSKETVSLTVTAFVDPDDAAVATAVGLITTKLGTTIAQVDVISASATVSEDGKKAAIKALVEAVDGMTALGVAISVTWDEGESKWVVTVEKGDADNTVGIAVTKFEPVYKATITSGLAVTTLHTQNSSTLIVDNGNTIRNTGTTGTNNDIGSSAYSDANFGTYFGASLPQPASMKDFVISADMICNNGRNDARPMLLALAYDSTTDKAPILFGLSRTSNTELVPRLTTTNTTVLTNKKYSDLVGITAGTSKTGLSTTNAYNVAIRFTETATSGTYDVKYYFAGELITSFNNKVTETDISNIFNKPIAAFIASASAATTQISNITVDWSASVDAPVTPEKPDELTVTVSNAGIVDEVTPTAVEGTKLYYAVVESDQATAIAGWEKGVTTKAQIISALDVEELSETAPELTAANNDSYLVVVELNTEGDTVVAAGQSEVIAITGGSTETTATLEAAKITVEALGTISIGDELVTIAQALVDNAYTVTVKDPNTEFIEGVTGKLIKAGALAVKFAVTHKTVETDTAETNELQLTVATAVTVTSTIASITPKEIKVVFDEGVAGLEKGDFAVTKAGESYTDFTVEVVADTENKNYVITMNAEAAYGDVFTVTVTKDNYTFTGTTVTNSVEQGNEDPVKSVSVGAISEAITARIASTPTYTVTTANIANDKTGAIKWYTAASEGQDGTAPTGITIIAGNVSSDSATLNVTADETTEAGNYFFTVTYDEVESAVVTLEVVTDDRQTIANTAAIELDPATGELTATITDNNATSPIYAWSGTGTNEEATDTLAVANYTLGEEITVTITSAATKGEATATITVYKIEVDVDDDEDDGCDATADVTYVEVEDEVEITPELDECNTVEIKVGETPIIDDGEGYIYTVDADDAEQGVITIDVTFTVEQKDVEVTLAETTGDEDRIEVEITNGAFDTNGGKSDTNYKLSKSDNPETTVTITKAEIDGDSSSKKVILTLANPLSSTTVYKLLILAGAFDNAEVVKEATATAYKAVTEIDSVTVTLDSPEVGDTFTADGTSDAETDDEGYTITSVTWSGATDTDNTKWKVADVPKAVITLTSEEGYVFDTNLQASAVTVDGANVTFEDTQGVKEDGTLVFTATFAALEEE